MRSIEVSDLFFEEPLGRKLIPAACFPAANKVPISAGTCASVHVLRLSRAVTAIFAVLECRLTFWTSHRKLRRVNRRHYDRDNFMRQIASGSGGLSLEGCEVMNSNEHERQNQFLARFLEMEHALRGFVRSQVPRIEDAREVMQETAAGLWRKFNDQDSLEEFRRWAFGVARYEAMAFARDRARDRHVFGEAVLELLAQEAEAAAVEADAEAETLEQCLRKRPAAQRALIDAAYAGGARIDELSRAAGRTPMAFCKSLHRIRMTLMDCMQRTLDGEAARS